MHYICVLFLVFVFVFFLETERSPTVTDVSRRPAALDRGPRSGRAPEAEAPGGDGHSEITPWKSTKAAKTLEPIKAE